MTMQRRTPGVCAASLLALASLGAAAGAVPGIATAVKDRDRVALRAHLQQREDVNRPLADGSTALQWAVYWNDFDTVDTLIRAGAKVNAANRFGATPLWMAASDGNSAIVTALLKAGADAKTPALGGEPVLMTAAQVGSVEVVKALLAHGADVNAREARQGQTALMWAVGGRDAHPAVAQALIERGADLNIRSTGGLTALLFAVREGDLESVRLLVKAGAHVNDKATTGEKIGIFGDGSWTLPSVDGSSALALAINNGHYAIASFLLDNGADPNATSDPFPFRTRPNLSVSGEGLKPGFTPIHGLVAKRARGADPGSLQLMKDLIAHGADVNARTASVQAPVPQQLNPQPAITWVQVGGITPFWIAANALDLETMRFLVASGADPKLPSMERTTPLMVAAGLGTKSRGPSGGLGRRGGVDLDVLKQLLDWGNDVNAVNEHGQTALHAAAFAAVAPVVQFLVDRGARLDLKDEIGRRPIEVAQDNLRVEYRPSLQNHEPADVDSTIALLQKLTQADAGRATGSR